MEVSRKFGAFYVTSCIVFGAMIFVSRSSLVDLHLKLSFVPPKNHEWVRVCSFLKNQKCSITYRITRHGCTIFLPLRETIEESAKRRHLWQYWAKRGAARCPECNAPEAVNKSGCKAGFEVGIGRCSPIPSIIKLYGSVLASFLGPPSFVIVIYCSSKGINVDFWSSVR